MPSMQGSPASVAGRLQRPRPRHMRDGGLRVMDGMTCPRCAELERERDAANAGIGRISGERDAAKAENRALREALKAARYELSVAASYADDPEATVGLRVHGKACA